MTVASFDANDAAVECYEAWAAYIFKPIPGAISVEHHDNLVNSESLGSNGRRNRKIFFDHTSLNKSVRLIVARDGNNRNNMMTF